MNRQEMIKHINTWFSAWHEVVGNLEGKRTNGWTVEDLPRKGIVLLKHGELAITREDFKPENTKDPAGLNSGETKRDEYGRPSIKGTKTFSRLVKDARASAGNGFDSARKKALINGEEYYMLDTGCRNCRQIHERHVAFPCTNEKFSIKRKKNKTKKVRTDPDMPKLHKNSIDFIESLNVKEKPDYESEAVARLKEELEEYKNIDHSDDFIKPLSVYGKKETTEKAEKTSNNFFSDVKSVVSGREYAHISNDVKKALIELIVGGLS